MKTVEELLCVLGGYVVGSVNPSYIIARIKGFDIRTKGSKNAGASNAVITMGKWVGIFSALFDIFKAFAQSRRLAKASGSQQRIIVAVDAAENIALGFGVADEIDFSHGVPAFGFFFIIP